MEYHCKYDALVDPASLLDHPRNHNKHSDRQVTALVAYIRHSGWRHAIVVSNLSGLIVAGHARKLAALKIGCDAPVVYQDFESDAHERTFLAADNKLAELAEVDSEILEVEIDELAELDVPVYDFGFEPGKNSEVSDPEIPEIDITDKLSLERVTLFVEEHIKSDVLGQLRAIVQKYDEGLMRIVT